ncbi:putative START-like domain superfamily protein [Helianthus debilis subsp. tardiflorus]
MEDEKQTISQYRDKLDTTLMSRDLSDVESLKVLVESQMSKSTLSGDQEIMDNLVQKRTKEVANSLSMLRSASGKVVDGSRANEIPHGGWKIKHDNQECRVMYREGPSGTPFHTLLVEGYVDGPLDVCMCLSWEAGLFPKWWPQFNIPTFRIISSECVKKVRMGEQISLLRMKLSWPVSAREALVHFVNLDYFQDDLIIVLLNTIPETEDIDISTHGFTRDGIPDVENVTRIDVVGGLALQKVSTNRSYFRAIANIDVKLDFVPPAIINFVSRQLIGSGFKLYKKKVSSVSKGDADFSKVLEEPFYGLIREALYSENNLQNETFKPKEIKNIDEVLEQKETEIVDGVSEQETVKIGQPEEHCTAEEQELKNHRSVNEIEEIEETGCSHEDDDDDDNNSDRLFVVGKKDIIISSEVNQALATLEKVISVFREVGFNPRSLSLSRFINNVFANLEDDKSNDSKHFVNELTVRNSLESRNSFSSRRSRHRDIEVGMVSREDENSSSRGTHRSSFSFAVNETMTSTLAENNDINGDFRNRDESSLTQKKTKKQRFCCFSFGSGPLVA